MVPMSPVSRASRTSFFPSGISSWNRSYSQCVMKVAHQHFVADHQRMIKLPDCHSVDRDFA